MDFLIDQYIAHLTLERGLAENSVESYAMDLSAFADFLEKNKISAIDMVDTVVILSWLIHMEKMGLTPRSPGQTPHCRARILPFSCSGEGYSVKPVNPDRYSQNWKSPSPLSYA